MLSKVTKVLAVLSFASAMTACGNSGEEGPPATVGIVIQGYGLEASLKQHQALMRANGIRVLAARCHLARYLEQGDRANYFSDVLFVYDIPYGDLVSAEAVGLSKTFKAELFDPSPELCSWTYPVIWTD